MILNFLIPQLAYFPVNENILFQQDGAISHTAKISKNAVNALFYSCVISLNQYISWSPTELMACGLFFLWGYLKSKVFEVNPLKTSLALKQHI
jgi:hypothetical protein